MKRLGEDVFLAHHAVFNVPCVQKVAPAHGLEDALASNEPAFLNRLDHPQIVPVREAQWDPQHEYAISFVMPEMPGGSVYDALCEDYRFSISQSIRIAIDALDALGYLHREIGAVHRDSKPGNILLDADRSRGYLSDFGSAAAIDAEGGARAVLGTDFYRPPESRPSGRVGPDADIYGVGMTLYEMVSERIQWEKESPAQIESRLNAGRRAIPKSRLPIAPHVPGKLRTVINRATNDDPARRPDSAEALISELRAVRCIDWRRAEGSSEVGTWFGTWPPGLREERRTVYRVASRTLRGGPDSGRLRVESHYRRPGRSWRHAVADKTIDLGDAAALSRLFRDVEASAAQRSPLR